MQETYAHCPEILHHTTQTGRYHYELDEAAQAAALELAIEAQSRYSTDTAGAAWLMRDRNVCI